MQQLYSLSEFLQGFHRIISAAECPHGIDFKVHIFRIRIFHKQLQSGLIAEFLEFMGMIMINKGNSVFLTYFSGFIVHLTTAENLIPAGKEIGSQRQIITADNVKPFDLTVQIAGKVGAIMLGGMFNTHLIHHFFQLLHIHLQLRCKHRACGFYVFVAIVRHFL